MPSDQDDAAASANWDCGFCARLVRPPRVRDDIDFFATRTTVDRVAGH